MYIKNGQLLVRYIEESLYNSMQQNLVSSGNLMNTIGVGPFLYSAETNLSEEALRQLIMSRCNLSDFSHFPLPDINKIMGEKTVINTSSSISTEELFRIIKCIPNAKISYCYSADDLIELLSTYLSKRGN
jgi:hypothetical protein